MPASGDSVLIDFGCQPQKEVSVADASSAFVQILDWLGTDDDLRINGIKTDALRRLLRGTGDLDTLARDTNIDCKLISQWLDELDASGIGLPQRTSGNFTPKNCRIGDQMNGSKTTGKPRTLDAALTRIEQLERELAAHRGANPAAQGAAPTKVATVTAPQRTPEIIKQELDQANHVGDRARVKALYSEYQEQVKTRRRGK
jgi:hypothetical protein